MNERDSREALERRRQELIDQLEKVDRGLQMELDRDIEEQAIEIEHEEVGISMERNLRRELAEIEDRLFQMNEAES
jgi:hypothetical protein